MIPPEVTFEVCVDFDAEDWTAVPDFSEVYDNISGDVDSDGISGLDWQRGKQKEEGNAPAATLTINLRRGLCKKYSPFTTGVLAGLIRPWLPIRVRAYYDGAYIPVYAGFISKISINPSLAIESVTFYCTDGIDLLARQEVTQDPANTTICSDGVAIGKLLDAAGWPIDKRAIDADGGDELLGYPATTPY